MDDFDGDDDDQRDDERWPPGAGLLSPPFEAQIIQSLAGKKATFMRHSATVHNVYIGKYVFLPTEQAETRAEKSDFWKSI